MNETNSQVFRTSDTALSAYLVSEGFSPNIEFTNGSKAYFLFPEDSPKLHECISDWDSARAKGNVVLFFNAYQGLLRRIRERY